MSARRTFPLRSIAVPLLLACLSWAGCYGTTAYVDTDDGAYDVDGPAVDPSPAFVATTPPYYYDGRPAYWYGNRWRYRDQSGRWTHYRSEPGPLRDARFQRRGDRAGFGGAPRGGGFRGGAPPAGGARGTARGGRWR